MASQEATTAITAEMEETIARISSHKGVEGVMIMNREGACCAVPALVNSPNKCNCLIFHVAASRICLQQLQYQSKISL